VTAVALLFVLAVAHLGPDVFASSFGGRVGSWETVCYGIEAACLWGFVAMDLPRTRGFYAVVVVGFFESIQRAIFRPLFPMDAPMRLPEGAYMADVATGLPISYLSPILTCVAVGFVVADFTAARPLPGRVG